MTHLDYIADADSILLWFPSQNRTFSVPKPYVFGSETVRFWDGERIKGRQIETDSIPFYNTLAHSLLNKLSN